MVTFDFSGKIVLVTGATGALGRVVARQFQQAGATLALTARNGEALHALFADLALNPDHLLIGDIDLTRPEDADQLGERLRQRFGQLHIVVNTVGGYEAGPPVHETPVAAWDRMMDLNVRSAFLVARATAPLLMASGKGAMVHVSGRAGLMGFRGRGGLLRFQERADSTGGGAFGGVKTAWRECELRAAGHH
jgi:NAD(P)-dependent dehydrogenase (short-subunit alcohol dehydrogenase family)